MSTPDGRPRVSGRGAGPGLGADPPLVVPPGAAVVSAREVRAWARDHGIRVARTGGLPRFVYDLYRAAHPRCVVSPDGLGGRRRLGGR